MQPGPNVSICLPLKGIKRSLITFRAMISVVKSKMSQKSKMREKSNFFTHFHFFHSGFGFSPSKEKYIYLKDRYFCVSTRLSSKKNGDEAFSTWQTLLTALP